jgi:hypothetical protein
LRGLWWCALSQSVWCYGSGLNLNVHFHTLALDGVFSEDQPDTLEFHRAPPPSDEEVVRVLATIRRRLGRLLARRGLEPGDEVSRRADRLAEESLALAGIVSASVQGRVALGPRGGARVRRLGAEPDPEAIPSRGRRQAHLDGFDLHANVRVPANDRARLEQPCRYLLRPPLAQERLQRRADGRILVKLKTAWHHGASHLLFEPLEFLEKLAALTPRPESNLLIYHGVLAPHAEWRPRAVAYGRAATEDTDARTLGAVPGPAAEGPASKVRYWSWAALMRRTFEIDVLACPRCGGRLRLIATVEDPRLIRRILALPAPSWPYWRPLRPRPRLSALSGRGWPHSVQERPHPRSRRFGAGIGSTPSRQLSRWTLAALAFRLDRPFICSVAWPRLGPPERRVGRERRVC